MYIYLIFPLPICPSSTAFCGLVCDSIQVLKLKFPNTNASNVNFHCTRRRLVWSAEIQFSPKKKHSTLYWHPALALIWIWGLSWNYFYIEQICGGLRGNKLCLGQDFFPHKKWQFLLLLKIFPLYEPDWKLVSCDWCALLPNPATLLAIMSKQFIPDHKRRNRNGKKKETFWSLRL